VLLDTVPPPADDPDAPLQAHVTNLDATRYLGRIALCRLRGGTICRGQQVAWCRADGTVTRVKIAELLRTEALTRVPAESASAGDLVAVAGIADVTIGDTLASSEHPVALPRIAVDEPAISMTIGINTSPLVGRDPHPGTRLTARQVKDRLDAELVGNVSIRVLPTARPDTWEVHGRGELALAVLVETMRREGFELTVGKPEVVTKVVDGRLHEPFEQLLIDVPAESLGAVTQLVAGRRGEMSHMVHGESRVRMDFRVPARGLIGFRTEYLTITRGAGIASHVFDGYGPWAGEISGRQRGSLVADRAGAVTAYAVDALSDRGVLFVGPGTQVYDGMVIGEHTRTEDLEVNIVREKKLTNMRRSTGDELVKLTPPTVLSLEQSLEFCAGDECVEVTPENVRIRKAELDAHARARTRARARSAG
jgi:GTP-binding protein